MNPTGAIAAVGVSILLIGCASHPPAATSTQAAGASAPSQPAINGWPILYHRTGGIAGTDDRVIIWPDGRVEVDGRVMPDAISRIGRDRVYHLVTMLGLEQAARSIHRQQRRRRLPDPHRLSRQGRRGDRHQPRSAPGVQGRLHRDRIDRSASRQRARPAVRL